MRSPFEDDDFKSRFQALCLGGGTHPRRIAADYNQPFRGHIYLSLYDL